MQDYPPSKPLLSLIEITPNGSCFVNGMSNSFPIDYPPDLEPFGLDENGYKEILTEINRILELYWPCKAVYCLSYLLCPCSLGGSFLISKICVDDAEKAVRQYLNDLNEGELKEKGLSFCLVRSSLKCRLQISLSRLNSPSDRPTTTHSEDELS